MQTHTRSGDKESAVSARWRHREQHARAKQPAQTPCRPPSVRGREQQHTQRRLRALHRTPSVLPLPPGPRVFPPVMENGGKGLLLRSPFSFTPRRPLRLSLLDSFCPSTPLLLAQDTTPPALTHSPTTHARMHPGAPAKRPGAEGGAQSRAYRCVLLQAEVRVGACLAEELGCFALAGGGLGEEWRLFRELPTCDTRASPASV